jgi:4-hydroxy-4-methyl-2-oxoglutarate aldolase
MTTIAEGRVYEKVDRVESAVTAAARKVATANLADAMHGLGVAQGLSPVGGLFGRIVGPAVTADVSPGDGSYSRIALALCQPGDVLVINAHGCTERAVLGGSVCIAARARGLAGIVVDGAVRDIGEIESVGLDVLARAVTPRSGTTESGWGEVNVPVAIGGVAVLPGDLVVADIEGCVIIPRRDAENVLRRVKDVEAEKGRPEEIAERMSRNGIVIPGLSRAEEMLQRRNVSRTEESYSC